MSKYEIVTRDQKRQWVAMIHGAAWPGFTATIMEPVFKLITLVLVEIIK